MLVGAFAVFTLVAVMGLSILSNVWRGYPVELGYPLLHGFAALLGSALVIVSALGGDARLYLNIGLAVIIILLGVVMGLLVKKGKKAAKPILLAHVVLAVACYGILGFFAFNPEATLI
jgi:NhaP-type Na+/H+ or K+/H+ antiporter